MLRIRLTITLGDDQPAATPAPEQRYVDAMGTHHDTGWTDTHMGFTTPAGTQLEDE
jgi:hypothetical protein